MENRIERLNLDRPLIFFDLETTGTNISADRIVELSYIKVYPDGREERRSRRINPGMPIPAEATSVHHITDADVAEEPMFHQVAQSLIEVFEGCDVAGFNSNRFDVPLLMEEFSRAGLKFDPSGRRFIDVQTIYHKKEPRTLVAAYRYYCNADLEGAHSALADTEATYRVLLSQLAKYDDLENDMDFLARYSMAEKRANFIDVSGGLRKNEKGDAVFHFGKYRGKEVREVVEKDPGYIDWVLRADFNKDTKDKLSALKMKYSLERRKGNNEK